MTDDVLTANNNNSVNDVGRRCQGCSGLPKHAVAISDIARDRLTRRSQPYRGSQATKSETRSGRGRATTMRVSHPAALGAQARLGRRDPPRRHKVGGGWGGNPLGKTDDATEQRYNNTAGFSKEYVKHRTPRTQLANR